MSQAAQKWCEVCKKFVDPKQHVYRNTTREEDLAHVADLVKAITKHD